MYFWAICTSGLHNSGAIHCTCIRNISPRVWHDQWISAIHPSLTIGTNVFGDANCCNGDADRAAVSCHHRAGTGFLIKINDYLFRRCNSSGELRRASCHACSTDQVQGNQQTRQSTVLDKYRNLPPAHPKQSVQLCSRERCAPWLFQRLRAAHSDNNRS